mgnify:CR=1 FL=1
MDQKTFFQYFVSHGKNLSGDANVLRGLPFEPTLDQLSQFGVFFSYPRSIKTASGDVFNFADDHFWVSAFANTDHSFPSIKCSGHSEGETVIFDKPVGLAVLSEDDPFLKELIISETVPRVAVPLIPVSDFVERE